MVVFVTKIVNRWHTEDRAVSFDDQSSPMSRGFVLLTWPSVHWGGVEEFDVFFSLPRRIAIVIVCFNGAPHLMLQY